MKIKLPLIEDSTSSTSSIVFRGNLYDTLEKPINLDWVQIDVGIIRNYLNKLPGIGSTLNGIKKLLPNFLDGKCNCRRIAADLGYGLKSTQYTFEGGYGSCTINVIHFGDDVLKLRLTIDNHKEIIEKYLFETIKLQFVSRDGLVTAPNQ